MKTRSVPGDLLAPSCVSREARIVRRKAAGKLGHTVHKLATRLTPKDYPVSKTPGSPSSSDYEKNIGPKTIQKVSQAENLTKNNARPLLRSEKL